MNTEMLLALFSFRGFDPVQAAHFLVALYLSISVHEAAHAWMANRCGDDTARLMGRMTLNPIPHIDPIGTVLMPILMTLGAGVPIGWAKPVPVNPLRFRNYQKGQVLVSLAGPVSNLMLAAASLITCWMIIGLARTLAQPGDPTIVVTTIHMFFRSLMMLNLVLALFNLIPIPPLDGSHILRAYLSRQATAKLERFLMPPFNYLVLFFVALPLLGRLFGPISYLADYLLSIWWR